jgi:hypothetical protein
LSLGKGEESRGKEGTKGEEGKVGKRGQRRRGTMRVISSIEGNEGRWELMGRETVGWRR